MSKVTIERMEIQEPDNEPQGNRRFFTILVVMAEVLGLSAVAMTAVWMDHYQGGFAWRSDPFHELSFHPLFMVLGMVFLYANAMFSFRLLRNTRKVYIKMIHGGIQIIVLVFVAVGLTAVFDLHNLNKRPIPNLYSLHSWLGLTTVILFGIQYLIGFGSFMFPKLSEEARKRILPMHVFLGMGIFCMAIGSALTGITEMALLFVGKNYPMKPPVGMLLNSLGLVLVAFALLVVYIVSRPEYKRQPKSDD